MESLRALQFNLKRLRQDLGLTQVAAAARAGLDYKHYQKIESGGWKGLQLGTLDALAKAFEVETWKLLKPPPDEPRIRGSKRA